MRPPRTTIIIREVSDTCSSAISVASATEVTIPALNNLIPWDIFAGNTRNRKGLHEDLKLRSRWRSVRDCWSTMDNLSGVSRRESRADSKQLQSVECYGGKVWMHGSLIHIPKFREEFIGSNKHRSWHSTNWFDQRIPNIHVQYNVKLNDV